jgi:hypothetical protein
MYPSSSTLSLLLSLCLLRLYFLRRVLKRVTSKGQGKTLLCVVLPSQVGERVANNTPLSGLGCDGCRPPHVREPHRSRRDRPEVGLQGTTRRMRKPTTMHVASNAIQSKSRPFTTHAPAQSCMLGSSVSCRLVRIDLMHSCLQFCDS